MEKQKSSKMGAVKPVWTVWKFGGSSLAHADLIAKVADLIAYEIIRLRREENRQLAVVVSAIGQVTSRLVHAVFGNENATHLKSLLGSSSSLDFAVKLRSVRELSFQSILECHFKVLDDLCVSHKISEEERDSLKQMISYDVDELSIVLISSYLTGKCAPSQEARILGQGELWSAQIVSMCVRNSLLLNWGKTEGGYAMKKEAISSVRTPSSCSQVTQLPAHLSSSSSSSSSVPPNIPHCPYVSWLDSRKFFTVYNSSDIESKFYSRLSGVDCVVVDWELSLKRLQELLAESKKMSASKSSSALLCRSRAAAVDPHDEEEGRNDEKLEADSNGMPEEAKNALFSTQFPPSKSSLVGVSVFGKSQTGISSSQLIESCKVTKTVVNDFLQDNSLNSENLLSSSAFSSSYSTNCHESSLRKENDVFLALIVTGYICSHHDGTMTTFKRNGSDYSASALANLLDADSLTIWSDVDGVYTADPRMVSEAFPLPFLTYTEAMELAYFGAQVLHPYTIQPCLKKNIPIIMKNTLRPLAPGTLISGSDERILSAENEKLERPSAIVNSSEVDTGVLSVDSYGLPPCKSFSVIRDISLINLVGTNMIGVPGIAVRLFAALQAVNCSVVMISQGSSEHSICIALRASHEYRAEAAMADAFHKEISIDGSMSISTDSDCCIVCAVGESMCGRLGLLGKLASALGDSNINIKAIAQGSSERNISIVVRSSDAKGALNALHATVYSRKKVEDVKGLENGLQDSGKCAILLLDSFADSSAKLIEDDVSSSVAWRVALVKALRSCLKCSDEAFSQCELLSKIIFLCKGKLRVCELRSIVSFDFAGISSVPFSSLDSLEKDESFISGNMTLMQVSVLKRLGTPGVSFSLEQFKLIKRIEKEFINRKNLVKLVDEAEI